VLNYCCTTPMPTNGVGNITLDPQLASASHLSVFSPCRGAGSADYATGTDIDGEAWASPPSIGCDELHAADVVGSLSVSMVLSYTNVATGYPVDLTALIEGRTTASAWEFGDGLVASNQPYATHTWTTPGAARWLCGPTTTAARKVSATVTVYVWRSRALCLGWKYNSSIAACLGARRPRVFRMRWTSRQQGDCSRHEWGGAPAVGLWELTSWSTAWQSINR
jgi:hypothetical protein